MTSAITVTYCTGNKEDLISRLRQYAVLPGTGGWAIIRMYQFYSGGMHSCAHTQHTS